MGNVQWTRCQDGYSQRLIFEARGEQRSAPPKAHCREAQLHEGTLGNIASNQPLRWTFGLLLLLSPGLVSSLHSLPFPCPLLDRCLHGVQSMLQLISPRCMPAWSADTFQN